VTNADYDRCRHKVDHMNFAICAAAVIITWTSSALAQSAYPNKSIDLIVPFTPGGTSDVIARIAADEMAHILGQTIVIENIGGAGGAIALAKAARATPDGYTFVIGNAGTNAAVYWTNTDVQFNTDSFLPIGLIAKTSPVISLRKDFPAKTPAEFLDYARKNPGAITLGHAGIGSSNYLICMSFVKAAEIDATLVSYRGAVPALTDLMGGHLDGVCDAATSVASAIQDNRVRGLVVSSAARLAQLPDVPDAAEAGIPAFQAEGWNAFFAPKGTPEPIIARLNDALRKAVASETVQKRFRELAVLPASGEEFSPDYVRDLVPREVEKYRKLLVK
jgi:tripartite-type tricarboxylate transporter receptor subunit TctC